jgi:hypothetical protein
MLAYQTASEKILLFQEETKPLPETPSRQEEVLEIGVRVPKLPDEQHSGGY